jgi:hypothetical protein
MKQSITHVLGLAITLFSGSLAAAQICHPQLYQHSPTERFVLDDAVAIDKRTNLVWQRCPLGQVWNKTTSQCDFSVMAKNWKDALESAPEGWRLPNLKELASIAEYRCSGPALNITVFPNLGNWNYWTSTVMKRLDLSGPTFNSPGGTITNDFSNYAWSIGTYSGVNLSGYKTEAKAARYVKDYQSESK